MLKVKITSIAPLLCMLAIPILNLFYEKLNHPVANINSLVTDLDQKIPFVPAFIVPYLIWYPYIFVMLVVLFFKKRSAYYQTLLSLCLGLVVCYFIYNYFQTTVARPPITEQGFLYSLVNFVYRQDAPYNCFPSIHVLTSYLILKGTFASLNISKVLRWLVFIISWTIIVSTLFVKQHALLDIAGAITLAEILFLSVGALLSLQKTNQSSSVTSLQRE